MSAPYFPVPIFRAFTSAGLPLAGGLLYTYAAGSLTPQSTYQADGSTTNANPVVLDSTGSATVRLQSLGYKFILKDSGGATQWTEDNYVPIGDSPTFSGTITCAALVASGNVSAATLTVSGASTTGAISASGKLSVAAAALTPTVAIGTVTTTLTVNCSLGNVFTVTMGGNVAAGSFTQTNPTSGQTLNIYLTQDGTGTRTLGLTGLKWVGGTVPSLSTAIGAVDLLVMQYIGTTWYASLTKAYA